MSEDKIKLTIREAIGLINYLNNLPSKELVPYETLHQEVYDMIDNIEDDKQKIKIYKALSEQGLNPTQFYIHLDKILTENDRKKLLLVRLVHGF